MIAEMNVLADVRWRDAAGNADRVESIRKNALNRQLFFMDLACRYELSGDKSAADRIRMNAKFELEVFNNMFKVVSA